MANPFAVTLLLDPKESIEDRIRRLLAGLKNPPSNWIISSIDATGFIGDALTTRLNTNSNAMATMHELVNLCEENGQIFELVVDGIDDDTLKRTRILVADGKTIDWLGFGDPSEASDCGPFQVMDSALYCWPD